MLARLIKALWKVPAARHADNGKASGDAARDEPASAHFTAGRYAQARPFYEALRSSNPGDAEILFRLGVIYGSCGLLNEAAEVLALAAHARPLSVDVINAQANVAWLQSSWVRAEQLFRSALALAPVNVTVLANFGLCLHDAGRLDDAAGLLASALELDPVHADALVNAALVRLDLGDVAGSQALIDRALAAAPDFPEAHALHAQLLLREGRYAEGWREYEWRLRCRGAYAHEASISPRWDGATDTARALMIFAEQGLGDQIMFASCIPDVVARAARCEIECDPRLVHLFARSFPAARFHARQPDSARTGAAAPPGGASQITIGSLPRLFRNERTQFPLHNGYLKPDPEKVADRSDRLVKLGDGLKVGIVWRGGVPRTRQTLRSIPLPDWLPLLQMRPIHFVSLQHGGCDDDYHKIAAREDVRIAHWQPAIDDCDETAALIAALDLVISVCGSVVHLAGAVGKAAWVLVPACPEWRYLGVGDRMPWYPAIRLFRQATLGDWDAPIAAIAHQLSGTLARANSDGHI